MHTRQKKSFLIIELFNLPKYMASEIFFEMESPSINKKKRQ